MSNIAREIIALTKTFSLKIMQKDFEEQMTFHPSDERRDELTHWLNLIDKELKNRR